MTNRRPLAPSFLYPADAFPTLRALDSGPYLGMRDSINPADVSEEKAFLLQNTYPLMPGERGPMIGRPGCKLMGGQLGGVGFRRIQATSQFTKINADGTLTDFTFTICGGQFYTFNWTTRVWAEVLSAADFTAAAITVDKTSLIGFAVLANKLVISDGVNTMWAWDGTAHGGLTKLVNAPVCYGPPTVYYNKLFIIKKSDRTTIVWSEESDPTTGYQAGGFDNSLQLVQTGQQPLVAIRGTNEQLVYWRERSMGAVSGPVTAQFKTDGTREGISEERGTTSPFAIHVHDKAVQFVDADGRPFVYSVGQGEPTPVWEDAAETLTNVPRASLASAVAADYSELGVVVFQLTETNQTDPNVGLVYTAPESAAEVGASKLPQLVSLWRGYTATILGNVLDGMRVPKLVHGASDGYVYEHANPDEGLWDDQLAAGTLAVQHVVQARPMGYEAKTELQYDRCDLSFLAASVMTAVQIDYETPRGISSALTATIQGAVAVWDSSLWDVALWSAQSIEARLAVGWAGQGRWIKPRLRHQTVGEQFGFLSFRVEAIPLSSDYAAP